MPIINSILPILVLLISGFMIEKFWLKDKAFWSAINKLVYCIFFPSLIVYDVANASIAYSSSGFIVVLIVLVFILLFFLRVFKFLFKDEKFWVVFVQGSFRYNSYVFIGVTVSYFNPAEAMPVIAIITASMISLANIVGLIMLNEKDPKNKKTLFVVIIELLRNPLIIACILGFVLNVLAKYAPIILDIEPLNLVLSNFSSASIVLSIMAVGASIKFNINMLKIVGIINCSIVKLIIFPVAVVLVLSPLGFDKTLVAICMIYAASPASTSAYAMVYLLKGDHESMGNIISIQIVMCIITIPILLLVFPYLFNLWH
ncbi:AEC family transporter [Francisella sp. Scap27]|uniref:AEC family transporter n=1 Tax=Francisella sp. Scap27 TaxID=2589986 RepID=UPI003564C03A